MRIKDFFLYNNLMELGLRHKWIQPLLPSIFSIKKRLRNIVFRKKLYFEIIAAEHCNLNCAMCSHYSPVAEPSFADPDSIKYDLARMQQLFKGYRLTCCILGGEPLLNPDIHLIIRNCRECLPDAKIHLCTNGLLLKHMEKPFWDALRECNIRLIVSSYPVHVDYDWIEEKAHQEGITNISREIAVTHGFVKNILSRKPDNAKRNMVMCDAHHRSHTLREGKLYTCHCAGNIHIYNKHFNEHLPEDNGVDIHKAKDAESIIKVMKQPCRLCAYCRPAKYVQKPWTHTQHEIHEWLDDNE